MTIHNPLTRSPDRLSLEKGLLALPECRGFRDGLASLHSGFIQKPEVFYRFAQRTSQ